MFKLSKLVAAGIFATLLTIPLTTKAEKHPLVGINYPPLPDGVEDLGGWIIEDPYAINRVSIEGQKILLLDRLIRKDSKGKPYFQVVNVLTLPPINTKTEQLLPGLFCTVNGKGDLNMIVVVKSEDDKPYLTKARKAWRVEGEEFKEVNVTNFQFKCENFIYGL